MIKIDIPPGISRLGLIGWLRKVRESKSAGGTVFISPTVNAPLYIRSKEWHAQLIKKHGNSILKDGEKRDG